MGYENGLDSDGEKADVDWGDGLKRDEKPSPLWDKAQESTASGSGIENPLFGDAVGYSPEQAVRALAASFAADLLERTGKPGFAGVKPRLASSEIIDLADWIVAGAQEEEQFAVPSSAEEFAAREAPLVEKVAERRLTAGEGFTRLLQTVAERIESQTSEQVAPADLREGDKVALDGDVLLTKPVLNEEFDEWSADAHCPTSDKHFEWKHPNGNGDVTVFGRGEA